MDRDSRNQATYRRSIYLPELSTLVTMASNGRRARRDADFVAVAEAKGFRATGVPSQRRTTFAIRQAHLVHGMIANREKRYDDAIPAPAKSHPQDRYVIYQTALAYQGTGVTPRG